MRKATKAGDDFVMMFGPTVVGATLHGLEQGQLSILIGHVFRMLKRQVEKPSQLILDQLVLSGVKRPYREIPRQRIGGEGMAGIAKHIAWKLVQQDQQGQRALWRLCPEIQFATGSRKMRVSEAAAEPRVESRVLGEPLLRACLFPEGDDVGRRYVCAHD